MPHQSAFNSERYRRYFPAAICSTLGGWTVRFLLGWSAWELTQSATWVGVVAGLMLAPALVLSPMFGIVADRINPRNGLLLTVAAQGVLAVAASVALWLEIFTLPVLLLFSVALGVATSAQTPIRLALVPVLVPREALPSAIGYSAVTFNTSRILGPALGAWLLLVASPMVAFLAAAFLMLGALPFLFYIQGISMQRVDKPEARFFQQLADGWHYTRHHFSIRLTLGFTLVNAMLGRTVIELLPALSGQLLAGDSATLATLTASAGAGSIVGGLVVSRQGSSEVRLFAIMSGVLAAGALLVAILGFAGNLPTVGVLIALISLITTIAGTSGQALAQLLVDDAYRGRVLSLWTMLAMGAPALGAVLMGWLADRLTFSPVLAGFGLLSLAAVYWLNKRRKGIHPDTAGSPR
ncbi:MFS transporter [Pseudohalioglobus lutimaris]|uniref:MFS transporter n=1 Tax=Pseudohalioglobus lutimaris TaxID=1737061 RepID=A0A2N5X815_9GAMM|nr:MFS transporter [Pseudohalioglobus lutimaris]PLW70636.1 MFS transporter [Pseudohalioglobus lutimaris]